jgi:hypothetical protein
MNIPDPKYRKGDRVRYVGATIGRHDKPATVLRTSGMYAEPDGHRYVIEYDDGNRTATQAVLETNLVLIERPIQVGDRVHYCAIKSVGASRGQKYHPDSAGTVTGLVDEFGISSARVDWDDKNPSGPSPVSYLKNLEIITVTIIDTTKPLEIVNTSGTAAPVTVIAEGKDGNITIANSRNSVVGVDNRWYTFTKEGRFHASEGGTGSAIKLRNVNPPVVHHFDITVVDGQPYFQPVTRGGKVQITTQGDALVSAVAGR